MRSLVRVLPICLIHDLNVTTGVKESDTGLASPNLWDLAADKQRMGEEHPLQVARCTKIIPLDPKLAAEARAVNPLGAIQGQKGADEQDKYVINIKQIAKFVVGLGDRVAATDIEEGMRVGYGCLLFLKLYLSDLLEEILQVLTGPNIRFRYLYPRKLMRR